MPIFSLLLKNKKKEVTQKRENVLILEYAVLCNLKDFNFVLAFLMSNAFWWIATVSVILGFLRAFIQIPLPLVVAETYPHRFVTAFSLYMVVCGFVALACGPITSNSENFNF